MNVGGTAHLARWARFHTGFWHAYPPVDGGGRYVRSVCGFATSLADAMEPVPGGSERWHCRQCRLVVGALDVMGKPEGSADTPEPGSPPSSGG